jgi:hypothetical protein
LELSISVISQNFSGVGNQVIYHTKNLPNVMRESANDSLTGCPLYIFIKGKNPDTGREHTSEVIASEIVYQSLPNSLFELPKGYKLVYRE